MYITNCANPEKWRPTWLLSRLPEIEHSGNTGLLSDTAHGWMHWLARRRCNMFDPAHLQQILKCGICPRWSRQTSGLVSPWSLPLFWRRFGFNNTPGTYDRPMDVSLTKIDLQLAFDYLGSTVIFLQTPKNTWTVLKLNISQLIHFGDSRWLQTNRWQSMTILQYWTSSPPAIRERQGKCWVYTVWSLKWQKRCHIARTASNQEFNASQKWWATNYPERLCTHERFFVDKRHLL